jgi:hypothetical protein
MSFPEGQELLTRSKAGDRSAFKQPILKYQDRIYDLCRHTMRDADDAQVWGLSSEGCRAVKGMIVHVPSGRSLRYGQLVDRAPGSALYVQCPINWMRVIIALTIHHRIILAEEVFLQSRFGEQ